MPILPHPFPKDRAQDGRQGAFSLSSSTDPTPSSPISFRVLNPLGPAEDPKKTFCDPHQARATTATSLFRDEEMLNAVHHIIEIRLVEERKATEQHPTSFFTLATSRKGKKDFPGLSIWSAGCSSGEEAYSIAIVALETFRHFRRPPIFRVFGTDIHPERIQEARAGQYLLSPAHPVRQRYRRLLESYATIEKFNVTMGDEIRRHVAFGLFDLRQRPRSHTFDLIVCNHVLQYYDREGQRQIVEHFLSVLRPRGILFLEGLMSDLGSVLSLERLPQTRHTYRIFDR